MYLVGVKVSRALHEVQGKAGGAGATGVRHLSRLAAAARAQIGHGQTSPGESRDARGRRPGVPAGTCGRGGADSYPSQYPTPAGLPAPAVQTDGTCGTGSGAGGPTDWRSVRARRLSESRTGRGPGPGRVGHDRPRGLTVEPGPRPGRPTRSLLRPAGRSAVREDGNWAPAPGPDSESAAAHCPPCCA